MSDQTRRFKVIIVGGGLSGCLLANGLIRHGVDVHVYERLAKDTKREGYQIRLGANALAGFRSCLTKDQVNRIVGKFGRAGGRKSSAPVLYGMQFDRLLDLSTFGVYSKSAPINRVALLGMLSQPVYDEGKLSYEKTFSRFEILHPGTPTERVRAWFQDGSYDDCDILIGADGSHSKINSQLGLNNLQQVDSHYAFVAKNDLPNSRYLQMTQALRGNPVMAFAENRTLYFCAYLPDKVSSGEVISTRDFDDTLSSSMFGAWVPTNLCPADILERNNTQKWEFLSSSFRRWAKEYHEIFDLIRDGVPLYVYKAMASVRPSKNWRQKVAQKNEVEYGNPRVWLIGDAIHCMLPNRGMGGNTALRDAATALPLLVRLAESPALQNRKDIAQACREYENEMIPRAFEWVEKSGGTIVTPIDTNTISGKVMVRVAALAMSLLSVYYRVIGLVFRRRYIDDAPELKE